MTNEISEKLFNILIDISKSLEPVPFWMDWNFWSLVALAATLFFLIRYTRATEKIAEYQLMPAVDVNMVYDKTVRKTYFWFSNHSAFAGFVYLEFKKNNDERKELYTPLRIAPKEGAKKTATTFDFSQREKDTLVLYISVRSALKKANFNFEFEKSYRFQDNQWIESSWAFPDPSFPNKKPTT